MMQKNIPGLKAAKEILIANGHVKTDFISDADIILRGTVIVPELLKATLDTKKRIKYRPLTDKKQGYNRRDKHKRNASQKKQIKIIK